MYYSVLVTDKDAIRVMNATKFHPSRFLELHSPEKERKGFYPKVCISNEWKVLGLKHNFYDLSCYFFMKNAGMCGINKSKPLVCRTYPFSLEKEGDVFHMNGTICPYKWNPKKGKESKLVKKHILQLRKEREEYTKKVKYWNFNYYWANFDKFIDFIVFGEHPTGYKEKKTVKDKIKSVLRK
jgi:Fe-S-cluster containining protein